LRAGRREPMRRKVVQSTELEALPISSRTTGPKAGAKTAQNQRKHRADSTQGELMRMTLRACLIARDATFNVQDLLTNSSRMAFLAVRDCEKELDQIERQIDEQLPGAITRVNERKARQLLACLKCITDLERIGDLVMGVAHRVQARSGQLPGSDVRYLVQMSAILRDMLEDIHRGFVSLDVESARKVLRIDAELDRICHTLFQKHLADNAREKDSLSFDVLLMAQALERAGDHAKNLAEELYGLIEGHTLRHSPKRTAAQ
jgi:phosphate transport system protein